MFRKLVGTSDAMRALFQKTREASKVDWTVLVTGETGTGKELVARALHAESPRSKGPFVAVNCAGLTDSLLASQLFGHRRGAFTGAVDDAKGVFEAAHGGTLLLDEIGDISINVQNSLLRVLESKEITRLGEASPRRVDVRVVAATSRDLGAAVEAGTFRADLLYRLRVARLTVPPLRERPDDIPRLACCFLEHSRTDTGKPVQDISGKALQKMLDHDWPGNVRELKSAVDFATLHCHGSIIEAGDLPPELDGAPPVPAAPSMGQPPQSGAGRVRAALEAAGGNRSRAARMLGISRATFYRRLATWSIEVAAPPEPLVAP